MLSRPSPTVETKTFAPKSCLASPATTIDSLPEMEYLLEDEIDDVESWGCTWLPLDKYVHDGKDVLAVDIFAGVDEYAEEFETSLYGGTTIRYADGSCSRTIGDASAAHIMDAWVEKHGFVRYRTAAPNSQTRVNYTFVPLEDPSKWVPDNCDMQSPRGVARGFHGIEPIAILCEDTHVEAKWWMRWQASAPLVVRERGDDGTHGSGAIVARCWCVRLIEGSGRVAAEPTCVALR